MKLWNWIKGLFVTRLSRQRRDAQWQLPEGLIGGERGYGNAAFARRKINSPGTLFSYWITRDDPSKAAADAVQQDPQPAGAAVPSQEQVGS